MTRDRPEDGQPQPVDETTMSEPDSADGANRADNPSDPSPRGEDDPEGLRDRYLRLAAEYENFRKRTERERAESWNRAQAHLVEGFLEPLDDLQRVNDFTTGKSSVESLHQGVEMVERKFWRLLEAAGLEEIPAEGKAFDPAVHEALMTVETPDPEQDHTIGGVLQRGYQFKGILLRPARVQVRSYEA